MKKIIIVDDVAPEANAMLQALYSRSPKSVVEHLEQVRTSGAEKFMANYYVGYGHKSIGDCGTTSIFAENVSMLVAKAIQDWPLYNGQEASTRYLDMAAQEVLNPLAGTDQEAAGQKILSTWMSFYVHILESLIPVLKERFPIEEGQKETVYEKAIKARAFDIARGFLPAGATTYASWHTNLRQAYDHLKEMRHHPLKEVRDTAHDIVDALKQQYPSSFIHKTYEAEEEYVEKSMRAFAYSDRALDGGAHAAFSYTSHLDLDSLQAHEQLLRERPAKAELHQRMRQFGNMNFTFPLDFGSYRDLQRQRSAVQEMPLLSTRHGFYPWYLEQLTDSLRDEAQKLLLEQEAAIAALACSDADKQYFVAMGYTVVCYLTCSLPSAVYIAELRSSDTVHPTLRVQAQRMGDAIAQSVPGIAMHHDTSPGIWNIKRGTQDIVRKDA